MHILVHCLIFIVCKKLLCGVNIANRWFCLFSLYVKRCYVVGTLQTAGFAFIVENRQRSFLHLSCFDIFRRPDSVYLVSEREEGNRHESLS